ncbi:MAG: serine hydrolase domain-containing protein [Lachnospiraceae bacterium]
MKRDTNALDQALQSLFEKRGYPGIAVTIRGPEGILFEKGYGYRDVEHQLPADTHTIFGIASMSKSITALCCAILATEGKLSLEDPITRVFSNAAYSGNPG